MLKDINKCISDIKKHEFNITKSKWSEFTVLLNDLGNLLMSYTESHDDDLTKMTLIIIHNYRKSYWYSRSDDKFHDDNILNFYDKVFNMINEFNKNGKIEVFYKLDSKNNIIKLDN